MSENDIFSISVDDVLKGRTEKISINTHASNTENVFVPEKVDPKIEEELNEPISAYALVERNMVARGYQSDDSLATDNSQLMAASGSDLSEEQQLIATGINDYLAQNEAFGISEEERATISVYCAKRLNMKGLSNTIETASVALIIGKVVKGMMGGSSKGQRFIPKKSQNNWNFYKRRPIRPFK